MLVRVPGRRIQRWERRRSNAAEQQQEAQWLESVGLVRKASAEIVATAEGLPAAFTREVEQICRQSWAGSSVVSRPTAALRISRGRCRKATAPLASGSTPRRGNCRNCFLNDTSRVVGESAEEVHRRVGRTTAVPCLRASAAASRRRCARCRRTPGRSRPACQSRRREAAAIDCKAPGIGRPPGAGGLISTRKLPDFPDPGVPGGGGGELRSRPEGATGHRVRAAARRGAGCRAQTRQPRSRVLPPALSVDWRR